MITVLYGTHHINRQRWLLGVREVGSLSWHQSGRGTRDLLGKKALKSFSISPCLFEAGKWWEFLSWFKTASPIKLFQVIENHSTSLIAAFIQRASVDQWHTFLQLAKLKREEHQEFQRCYLYRS